MCHFVNTSSLCPCLFVASKLSSVRHWLEGQWKLLSAVSCIEQKHCTVVLHNWRCLAFWLVILVWSFPFLLRFLVKLRQLLELYSLFKEQNSHLNIGVVVLKASFLATTSSLLFPKVEPKAASFSYHWISTLQVYWVEKGSGGWWVAVRSKSNLELCVREMLCFLTSCYTSKRDRLL